MWITTLSAASLAFSAPVLAVARSSFAASMRWRGLADSEWRILPNLGCFGERLGCGGEQLGGGFAGCVAILKASLVLGVDSQPYRIILGDFDPGVRCQSILFAESLIAEEPLAIS